MKKCFLVAVAALSCAVALGQGAGRRVYRPGQTQGGRQAPPVVNAHTYDRTPGYDGHVAFSPFALGFGAWGMPYGSRWAICGLRFNLGLPGWTSVYEGVYGIDAGLAGETIKETGGVAVNAFSNTTRDFYGIALAGLWNRTLGADSSALQVAPIFNFAEGLEGVQIGIFNRARELHGVQIGVYNIAVSGGGLQIGLWNDNASGMGSPILGIVF